MFKVIIVIGKTGLNQAYQERTAGFEIVVKSDFQTERMSDAFEMRTTSGNHQRNGYE